MAQYGERCKRKVNDNHRVITATWQWSPTSHFCSAKWFTQASTCRKVPGTGRLPRSTLFVSLRYSLSFYSLSSPPDVKCLSTSNYFGNFLKLWCKTVPLIGAADHKPILTFRWIWASQDGQDALTDADGSHGDVDPEELHTLYDCDPLCLSSVLLYMN